MSATRAEWKAALEMAERLGSAPTEAVQAALSELASRKPAELTPAMVAFWVDLPETVVSELLSQVRALAVARTVETTRTGHPRVLGDFELLGKLGQGGMGAVFRARQRSLDRTVALKLLAPNVAQEPEGRQRFLREARALAAVNHPNVVTCYQVGEVEGQLFIALELLSGGDAQDLADQHDGRLPERRALELARDCASGLVALESAGLIHRDIKPTNVFIDEEGHAKLGDLGLARHATGDDRVTLTGLAVGTPAFMAPEQLIGHTDLDIRTDVYALGATLYCLLTGETPSLADGKVPDPRRFVKGLSPKTAALLRKALTVDRKQRYATAEELLRAVHGALKSLDRRPATTRPRPAITPVPERTTSAPLVAASGGVALLFLVGFLAWSSSDEPRTEVTESEPILAVKTTEQESPPIIEEDDPPPKKTADPTPPAKTEPEPRPKKTADPAPPTKTESDPPPAQPLGLAMFPDNGTLRRRADGVYVSTPGGGSWSRAGLFGQQRRDLPLRVRWTCQARATRDSRGLAGWERGHGFQEPAGFFYELGVRASNRRITAARELRGGCWWVTVMVQRSGRVLGLVRVINRTKPRGQDLIAVPQPGLNRTAGVDVVARFVFEIPPGAAFDLDVDFDSRGWSLRAVHDGQKVADLNKTWRASARAPLQGELDGGVYLWGHLGNFSSGQGTGSLATFIR